MGPWRPEDQETEESVGAGGWRVGSVSLPLSRHTRTTICQEPFRPSFPSPGNMTSRAPPTSPAHLHLPARVLQKANKPSHPPIHNQLAHSLDSRPHLVLRPYILHLDTQSPRRRYQTWSVRLISSFAFVRCLRLRGVGGLWAECAQEEVGIWSRYVLGELWYPVEVGIGGYLVRLVDEVPDGEGWRRRTTPIQHPAFSSALQKTTPFCQSFSIHLNRHEAEKALNT
jgi:hypothetical protein